jgi:hypothetical protein
MIKSRARVVCESSSSASSPVSALTLRRARSELQDSNGSRRSVTLLDIKLELTPAPAAAPAQAAWPWLKGGGKSGVAAPGAMGLRFFEAPPCRFPQCGVNCSETFEEVTGRALPAVALVVLVGSAVLSVATVVLIALRLRGPGTRDRQKSGLKKVIVSMLLIGSVSCVVAAGEGLLLNSALSPSSKAVTYFATAVAGACVGG